MDNFGRGLKQQVTRGILLLSLTAFLVVLGVCLLQRRPVMAQDQQVQVVELKAKKYEYLPSPVQVRAGTKVQLKITAVDHDHGFKIETVPNGAGSGAKPGLIFDSPQDCWQFKKGETTQLRFSRKRPAPTHLGAATLVVWAIEA